MHTLLSKNKNLRDFQNVILNCCDTKINKNSQGIIN